MDEKQKQQNKITSPKTPTEKIVGLDLSFQGLKSLSNSLFLLSSIRELLLNNNELEIIPHDICKLRCLEKLNLAHNKLKSIPPTLGRLVGLRELHLNDNLITTVPMEMGSLYNLETLNLGGNPLISPFNGHLRDRTMISFCRENNTAYPPPADRAWVDTVLRRASGAEMITVGTYNILCNYFASKLAYAPSWVLNPEMRKETILQNIVSYNADILCLQELETYSYNDFYKDQLEARLGYDSAFCPKRRSLTLIDKKTVDGCATFWKKSRFRLQEQINIDFYQKITTDLRFSLNQDILNRHARKDNVALITVLEKISTNNVSIGNISTEATQEANYDAENKSLIIVVNVHLYWDPEYADVKLFQSILILEELEKIKNKFKNAPIILLGDFNSIKNSSVYDLITKKSVSGHDFNLFDYSPHNNGYSHSTPFFDAYANQDLTFTNFTPTFKETIDYIFYSRGLSLISILSPVEDEYTESTIGLPNIHFPSDHIFIGARFLFNN